MSTHPDVAPRERSARRPPERRGVPRDGVRLLVAAATGVRHTRFTELPDLLQPGDLVVVNTSGTLPAALAGLIAGRGVGVHVNSRLDDGTWVVEIRRPDGGGPELALAAGTEVHLAQGVRLTLVGGYPDTARFPTRLWRVEVHGPAALDEHLARVGRPIRYPYVDGDFPLRDYQTVYAAEPGSAEMPSAGRPISERLLARMVARGVPVADVTLHAGVSSPELHEPPAPERFAVPPHTADLVTLARRRGRRVLAVGTTVVRALESAVTPWGQVRAGHGWTDLVLDGSTRTRVVDGVVTGLHEARSSHLALLRAVAGAELVEVAYAAVLQATVDYLWHEFGDSMLLLP